LPWDDERSVVDRARKYLEKVPPAVSGQGGHNSTFHAACILVIDFGLQLPNAKRLLMEWNQACKPPWSERDLDHKLADAEKQPGERNRLRNAKPENWGRIQVRHERRPRLVQAPLKMTTLEEAAMNYLTRLERGVQLVELGNSDIEYAIEGGVEYGEMVILAARPSHGKSALALQIIHHCTAMGMPAAFVSEEMSDLALGKRVVQFVSDVPQEHWRVRAGQVFSQLQEHFSTRASCHVIESCGSADRAAEAIRRTVNEHGAKIAVVDYAQLLSGPGKSRYEQVTNTSVVLRQLASETSIVLFVLCQLSRQVEERNGGFMPRNSDLKDSGQLEQDADVILHLVWPWKIDNSQNEHEYHVYVGKNRNRAINQYVVKCSFLPSRQMVTLPAKHAAVLDQYARDLWRAQA
jgi:KaiC/GvpD/RAD55 family RecA-like ATPase